MIQINTLIGVDSELESTYKKGYVFGISEILKELQSFISLEDGDIVMTGTPKGVGVIAPEDSFVGQIYLQQEDSQMAISALVTCQWQAQ